MEENKLKEREVGKEGPWRRPWSSSFPLAARKGDGKNSEREKLVSRTLGGGGGRLILFKKVSKSQGRQVCYPLM